MMYGTVETDEERLEHLLRLRALQDETGGFTAFITWSYQPDHTELAGSEATGIDYLRTLALARIVLDNFDNLQASWVTQGGKVGQLSLAYGANDMGSVMIEENVVRAAGASYCMDEVEIVRNIEDAGFAAEAPQHALRDSRRSDLPRARRAADAGARDRARGRRHAACPDELRLYPGAQPRRQDRRSAGLKCIVRIDPLSRRPGCCPIGDPPIRDGWVDRSIAAAIVGGRRPATSRRGQCDAERECDLGQRRVLPGLVNAHTHLELSYLRDAVPPASEFVTWIRSVMAARRQPAGP